MPLYERKDKGGDLINEPIYFLTNEWSLNRKISILICFLIECQSGEIDTTFILVCLKDEAMCWQLISLA